MIKIKKYIHKNIGKKVEKIIAGLLAVLMVLSLFIGIIGMRTRASAISTIDSLKQKKAKLADEKAAARAKIKETEKEQKSILQKKAALDEEMRVTQEEMVTNPGNYSTIDNMSESFLELEFYSITGSNNDIDKKLTGNDSIVADVIDLAITGKHIETENDNALGGAILSGKDAEIASILGGFKNNHAKSVNADAKGGAVYNAGKMGSILGNAHIIKSENKITIAGGGGKDTLAIDVSGTSEIGGNLISIGSGVNNTTIDSGEDNSVIGGTSGDSLYVYAGKGDFPVSLYASTGGDAIDNPTVLGDTGDESIGGGGQRNGAETDKRGVWQCIDEAKGENKGQR